MIFMTQEKQKYRTVRIYPEDAQRYKRLSYMTGKPIVRLISEALELLEAEHEKNKSENMYF